MIYNSRILNLLDIEIPLIVTNVSLPTNIVITACNSGATGAIPAELGSSRVNTGG